ncbi:DUF6286 domain-containing protein [Mycolicibacterium sp. 050158]|uniref:DUF6286 domain-containing protein n=1 Tax=Mycolicibacterium sp. 050158 TaxID=3090602 RepID=UPI00299D9C47|nr:DUF6286 domain-containing protein [Mycolicibacterium sp. 050158]MDX1890723.1 DUF6286 domain-containing protein [Mycolicibacterium sp. 050158]
MTATLGRTSSSADDQAATPLTPAKAPVAAPAAGYVGTLIAVLLLGLGVVGLRDGAVAAGWLDGMSWTASTVGWLDGLSFAGWMIPVGVVAVLIGVWSVLSALRPRRRTATAVNAQSSVWIGPADLARLATAVAEDVPGVLRARSTATLRKITVTAHTTGGSGATGIDAAVADSVRHAVAILREPVKVRVRTRRGDA